MKQYQICLQYVRGESSLSSNHIKFEEEKCGIELKEDQSTVNLSQVMGQLLPETQKKMEGKIISYYHRSYKSFVFLGCTLENPKTAGQKAFDPNKLGCVNALDSNKDILLQNMLVKAEDSKVAEDQEQPNGQDQQGNPLNTDPEKMPYYLIFKVRDRAKIDQVKSLVQGTDESKG